MSFTSIEDDTDSIDIVFQTGGLLVDIDDFRRQNIEATIRARGGNLKDSARDLGLTTRRLIRTMRELGVES